MNRAALPGTPGVQQQVGTSFVFPCSECGHLLHFRYPDPYVPAAVLDAAHERLARGLRMHLRYSCRRSPWAETAEL